MKHANIRNTYRAAKLAATTLCVLSSICSLSASASYTTGYYDSLDGKSGTALFNAVKAMANGHTKISYGTPTWNAFKSTDVRVINGTAYWWDMYSNNNVAADGHSGMNIEHSVANSWWGHDNNNAYCDIVHLNPSDATANSNKSNYPLGECSTDKWNNGVTFVGKPKAGQGGEGSYSSTYVYEPHDMYKGDFARVFMYMFVTYDDISWETQYQWMYNLVGGRAVFQNWAKELLLRWHDFDPVSDKERSRNDGIEKEQGNRNPFIDLPDLADYIWGAKAGQTFYLDGHSDTPEPDLDPDPEDSLDIMWFAGDSTGMDPDWNMEDIILPSVLTSIWYPATFGGQNCLKATAYVSGQPYESESYIYSIPVSLEDMEVATLSFDHAAKFQTNCRELCYPVIRKAGTTEWTALDIPEWPVANTWDFTNSGEIDLADYIGYEVEIGFRYASTSEGADTWEIRNVLLHRIAAPEPEPEPVTETRSDVWFDESNSTMEPDWTIDDILLPSSASYIWTMGTASGKNYLKASAYISSTAYASESYIYSPEISLEYYKSASLTFDHTAKFQTTCRDLCAPVIREADSEEWHELYTPTWPTAGNWNFVSSDPIDLSAYLGKKVHIGFKYASTTSGADTWEIRNVTLNRIGNATSTVIGDMNFDDSELVEVWGRTICAPRGARIFDLNGREVNGENVAPGVYIVVKPTFAKSVKVLVK